jgi:crotonobetainyl-CoA:carnitine CoA-transferase CaiB-like acyl-CoA transferase|tara:strand:- start:13852 stop:16194 length:2343 start_codon:yes stop_codon:yes gene_type:complete
LADFGAEVIMLVDADEHPPGKHPIAELAPFDGDGNSIPALYVHANKQLLHAEFDSDGVRELIQSADVLIESSSPARRQQTALDYDTVQGANPGIIYCSLTAFGQDGERADYPGNDLTLHAYSGWASLNGLADHPPLKGSGFQASYQAGTAAYAAILAALLHRFSHPGEGQQIDIAELEVLCSTFSPAVLGSACRGIALHRRKDVDITGGPVPVKDGHFALTISRAHFWRDAMDILGLPELGQSEDLQKSWYRQRHKEEFVSQVQERMKSWNRMDLFNELAARRVIAGPVLTMAELAQNEHLRGREFFQIAHDGDSSIEFPGAPFKMSESRWQLKHDRPIASTALPTPEELPSFSAKQDADPRRDGPFSGYRGVVLTQAWAGSYSTQLMALMGAEVIQVEVRKRPDSWRGLYDGPMPAQLEDATTAHNPHNCNPLYNSVNLNKLSVTLDLSETEGLAVFRDLVKHADFVAENFSPRVMGNLGIGYESLRRIKEDIILLSLSAYGHSGPWANVPGIGGTLEPTSGMSALLGYPDGFPLNSGQMYPDAVAGLHGFAALTTALMHRQRTGKGQFIDLSMQEANFTFIGDAWLEFVANGNVRARLGNRHMTFAPHGIFTTEGDDQWIAVAAETELQWQQLCGVAGHQEWLDDSRFVDNSSRKENEDVLDLLIGEWTATEARDELAQKLAQAGVIAAPVLDPLEVGSDRALRDRGAMVAVEHPETGRWYQPGVPFRMSLTSPRVRRHAPLQGQDSLSVYKRLLNMSEEAYENLVKKGISGSGPLDN